MGDGGGNTGTQLTRETRIIHFNIILFLSNVSCYLCKFYYDDHGNLHYVIDYNCNQCSGLGFYKKPQFDEVSSPLL